MSSRRSATSSILLSISRCLMIFEGVKLGLVSRDILVRLGFVFGFKEEVERE